MNTAKEAVYAEGINITSLGEKGQCVFEDSEMCVLLSEDISNMTILWDERNGYWIGEDGRNIRDLIVSDYEW